MNRFKHLRGKVTSHIPQAILNKWNPSIQASAKGETDIGIYEPIGYDYWTGEGMTANRMAGILRSIGSDKDVVVNINSPGGDVFEGLAIYNLLKQHEGKVTVRVLGLAASAASFIAMAGDSIEIGKAAFFMIHNAWTVAAGDRHELRQIADWLEPFDQTIAGIYADRAGIDAAEIAAMLDKETWLGGEAAIEAGFATALLETDTKEESKSAKGALYKLDAALAQAGMPRTERRAILKEITSMPSASGETMHNASHASPDYLSGLTLNL